MMAPSTVHLPNGSILTVTPVFGGLFFKSNDLSPHHSTFPAGWTIIINCEDDEDDHAMASAVAVSGPDSHTAPGQAKKQHHVHRFRKPSLHSDHLFISSISNPSSSDFRPPRSQTRSIAMMLWATLWWYFHQPEPSPTLTTNASVNTVEAGRPRGEWRVNINREGIFTGKHLLPKLERMGLIASEDSTVGLDPDDGVNKSGEGWTKMFVSRRSFWQLDPRIYLFTLTPTHGPSPFPSASPASSRPASPDRRSLARNMSDENSQAQLGNVLGGAMVMPPHLTRHITPPGPFTSNSHLPTYYPAPPTQYIFTKSVRHPIRPKPPRQGETFYTRYIPSLGQYLSFRVASLSSKPCAHMGPTAENAQLPRGTPGGVEAISMNTNSRPASRAGEESTDGATDVELLHRWMNDPRVAHSWGESGPSSHQRAFLEAGLTSKHSFPVIGCFDGRPFGYFEIYWVREDRLGSLMGGGHGAAHDYDRGLHVLVGENAFRGPERVRVWLSALLHYCWLADPRTETVMLEPRVDNTKLLNYCQELGFYKEREISFPHKQSNLLKIRRETWEAPMI